MDGAVTGAALGAISSAMLPPPPGSGMRRNMRRGGSAEMRDALNASLNEPTPQRPTHPNIIANLPTFTITQDMVDGGSDRTCSVCYEPGEVGDDMKTLLCMHSFHTACIDRWLGMSNACPVCKQIVSDN